MTSCRVRSAGTGSARGSDGGPNERRAWGVGREQVGCVAKTHRDAERCVIARSTHPIGSRPSPAGARPGSTPPWSRGDPPCSFPPWPRRAAGSDRFWLLELRVSQHFSTFYEPSVQAMDTHVTRQRSRTGRPSVEGDGPVRRPCPNQRNKPHRKENARQSQLCSMPAWCSRVMSLPAAHWRLAMAKGLATVRDGESGCP